MPYIGTPPASELANLDINGQSLILDADADTHITADTDDQIDIHISGADDFQFTANTFTAQSGSTITTPTLGVVNTKDLGSGIHIKTADSGASVNADEDELVIEGSGNVGMAFLGATGSVVFGDSGVGRSGRILYDMGDDYFDFGVNTAGGGATSRLYLSSRGAFIGDTTNGKQALGLTINQGADDDAVIALKSSDVSHGVTDIAETDTFGVFQKAIDATGGLEIVGIRDTSNTRGLVMKGYCSGLTDSASTSANAAVEIHGFEYSGANATNATANGLIFGVVTQKGNATTTIFLVDEDGDISYDGSDAGAYDEYEDAQLTRALDLSHGRNVIDSKFDKFIAYNHEKLADLKLVGREENGEPTHFINLCGMQRLHNGAIWQQYEKHQNLLNAVYELAVKSVGQEEADAILEKNEVKLLKNDSLLN